MKFWFVSGLVGTANREFQFCTLCHLAHKQSLYASGGEPASRLGPASSVYFMFKHIWLYVTLHLTFVCLDY